MTKRCAVAAAGLGMVVASFAAAAGTAGAATHHPVAGRVTPHIVTPTDGVTATSAAPVEIAAATLAAGTSVALPSVTITDPGVLESGQTLTMDLYSGASQVSLDTTATPTVSPTGATATGVAISGGTVSFTITKTATADHASFVVSGIKLIGATDATSGALGFEVTATGTGPQAVVPTFDVGAVTHLVPAVDGATSPDTAAKVFDSADDTGTNDTVVLASDYEPQDAESANYLAGALADSSDPTGILLTDPTTLSAAASTALTAHPSITTVYIVGGTSVVSAGIEAQLKADGYEVIRLGGVDQYATNELVVQYVAQNLGPQTARYTIDYAQTQYNDTSGSSSATSTGTRDVKTAVLASGSIDSFQDGIVSGPLAYGGGFPVILTTPTSLSASASSLLISGGYRQVILLGGPAAVSNAVVDQLTALGETGQSRGVRPALPDDTRGITVFRIAGQDASDTSTKLASFLVRSGPLDPIDDGTFDGGVLIARGTGFQDALATGPYGGGIGNTPILLTENASTVGAPLTAYLKSLGEECIFAAQAVGGPLSVTPAVQTAAIDAEFSGLSGCTPTNAVASATAPTAPTLDSVTGITASVVLLDFSAPSSDGGSAITGYQYSFDDGSTWTDVPSYTGTGPYSAEVPISSNGTVHVVMRAVNVVGDGPASNEVDYNNS